MYHNKYVMYSQMILYTIKDVSNNKGTPKWMIYNGKPY